jgi:hypothetical protein
VQAFCKHDTLAHAHHMLAPEIGDAAQEGGAPRYVHPLHAAVMLRHYEEHAVAPHLEQLAHSPKRPAFGKNLDEMLLLPGFKPSQH